MALKVFAILLMACAATLVSAQITLQSRRSQMKRTPQWRKRALSETSLQLTDQFVETDLQ